MKVTAISDTHTKHENMTLPGGDILIHAGDATWLGQPDEIEPFIEWLSEQDYTHKVFIAGNHDLGFEPIDEGVRCEKNGEFRFRGHLLKKGLGNHYRQFAQELGVHYLESESIHLEGLHIYGSPYQPEFCNWAFNYKKDEVRFRDLQYTSEVKTGLTGEDIWENIPENVDILVTHGPPRGVLDIGADMRLGCPVLRKYVKKRKPKYHIFGHIHEGHGIKKWKHTTFINASFCQRCYQRFNKSISFEVAVPL